jgi:hypothetical protein
MRRMGRGYPLVNPAFNPTHPANCPLYVVNSPSCAVVRSGSDAAYAASAAARCLRTNRQSVSSDPSATK